MDARARCLPRDQNTRTGPEPDNGARLMRRCRSGKPIRADPAGFDVVDQFGHITIVTTQRSREDMARDCALQGTTTSHLADHVLMRIDHLFHVST